MQLIAISYSLKNEERMLPEENVHVFKIHLSGSSPNLQIACFAKMGGDLQPKVNWIWLKSTFGAASFACYAILNAKFQSCEVSPGKRWAVNV